MQISVIKTGPFSVNTLIIPLCSNKVFIVDPADCDFSRDTGKVVSYLSDNNLEAVAVVLTHGHFDHISGLPELRKNFPKLPILIHEADSKSIGAKSGVEQGQGLFMMGFREFIPFVSNLPEASSYLKDEKSLLDCLDDFSSTFDDELKNALSNWKIIHTPGHTPGCVCLLNKSEKILVSGDTLFYHSWGRTDLPGGNEENIQKSLRMIIEEIEDDVKIYPGHDKYGFTKRD